MSDVDRGCGGGAEPPPLQRGKNKNNKKGRNANLCHFAPQPLSKIPLKFPPELLNAQRSANNY